MRRCVAIRYFPNPLGSGVGRADSQLVHGISQFVTSLTRSVSAVPTDNAYGRPEQFVTPLGPLGSGDGRADSQLVHGTVVIVTSLTRSVRGVAESGLYCHSEERQ